MNPPMPDTGVPPSSLRHGTFEDAQALFAAHLGEVLWVRGQQDRARAIWREGLALDPEHKALRETLRRFQVQP